MPGYIWVCVVRGDLIKGIGGENHEMKKPGATNGDWGRNRRKWACQGMKSEVSGRD